MEQFLQPNNADEVRTGLFNMRLIKALGIDGMHALFFHKFWHIVSSNVVSFVLSDVNSSLGPKSVNKTLVELIPKVKSPKK